ncbi:uncharacterized protein LOC100877442 [Megachile rotundata]|uniref:uncharacterized protein LOC100877442 n=1 Tax=Megachile rotundata TaxID=143995 RepID=UPI003FD67F14
MKRLEYHICFLSVLVARSLAEDFTLNIDFDKPIAVTDEKFLSLTIDPETLLTGNAFSTNFEKSVNLARAMSPAYVRFERPASFRFTDSNVQDVGRNEITELSASDWIVTNQWAKKAGLDVIACVSAADQRDKIERSEDAMEIISFTDHMAFKANWQLGYECQARCNVSASNLARQTVNLRKILNEFPRYSSSLVTGPNIVAYRSEEQRQYLRDYFNIAAPALTAVTWHPDFASVTLDDTGALVQRDNLEEDREDLLSVIGRFMDKQQLWIAESKPEALKNLYIGALILARRLGNAARSKINVFMRQPTDLTQPSADYWVSLLHKTLVGRKVFDAKTSDKDYVYLYCQCTKPSNKYEKGSVTIFGVNLNPEEVTIDLKGMKIDMVHEYILSPGFTTPNRMFSESVFLNNKTLDLINDTVPELVPDILSSPEGVKLELHPGGIGFWVLPNLKIKSCMEDDKTSEGNFEGLRNTEDVKIHVTRSVQDTSTLKTEKKQKISSRASRKSILKRELKKLRNFARKKLDDYDTAKVPLKPEDSSTSRPENAGDSRTTSADAQESRNDIQNKLQGFKDRILRIRSISRSEKMKSTVDKIVTDVASLLSKVQTALHSKREIDPSDKLKSSSNVKDHLQSLFDFLNRVDFNESKAKVVKRDLYSRFATTPDQKRENILRKRSGIEHIRIVPSIVELENSDSDEHTFYGFFQMNPAEGFPRGDVSFATGGLPRAMDGEAGSQENESDSPEPEYSDYDIYGEKMYPPAPSEDWQRDRNAAELWEAEMVDPRPERSGRTIYANPLFRALDFSTNTGYRRSKREVEDLHEILDQEMINEDDANLKDCNCRVIRSSKACNCRTGRDVAETVETATLSEVESLNSHDIADVEVFSELKEAPMESQTESNLETEPNAQIDLEGISSEMIGVTSINPLTTVSPLSLNDQSIKTPIQGEDDTSLRAEARRNKEQVSTFEATSSEVIDANVYPVTPYTVTPVSTLNEDDQSLKTPVQRERVTPTRKKPRKSKVNWKLSFERFPSETVSVTAVNLEDSNSETPSTISSLILAPNEDDESLKIQRERNTFLRESKNEQQTTNVEEIPITQASINLEDFDLGTVSTIPSLTPVSSEDESVGSVKSPVRREGGKFFLENSKKTEAKETAIDIFGDREEYSSNSYKNSTPSTGEEAATKKMEESSSTASLWEQEMAKESKMDYNIDQGAAASAKREIVDKVPKLSVGNEARSSKDSQRNRKQNLQSKRIKSNIAKARETQLMQRAKVLSALAKMIRGKTGDEVYKFGPKKSKNKNEKPEQPRKTKLPERKRPVLQNLQKSIDDEMTKIANENRNLKRRQTWEIVEDSDDLQDVRDCDKMACVLVYNPTSDDSESSESIDKRDVPTEIRKGIFNPKSQRDSTVEHSNPDRAGTEIVQLKELLEEKTAKIESSSVDDDNEKTYFALVENLDRPRIFHLREHGEEKRNAQTPRFRSNYDSYNRPRNRLYRKEIYVIDPSEYRGGEPTLQPYRNLWRPQTNSRSRNVHGVIRKVLRKPYRSRKTEQHKREDKVSDEESDEFEELSENVNTGELLKALIDNLDLQSVEELFKQLNKYNTIDEKHNFIRSIFEEMKRKRSEEDAIVESEVVEQSSRNTEYSKENESLEILDDEETVDQIENHQDIPIEDLQSDEDATSFEVSIIEEHSDTVASKRRRDTSIKPEKDYLVWLKPGQDNYLSLEKRSEDSFDGASSKILDVLKKNEEHKVMPVKRSNLDDLSVRTNERSFNILEDETSRANTTKKFDRSRRQAVDREMINENTDMVQPSELQHLEGSSSQKNQTSTEMDDIEKSLVEKIPIEKYTKKEDQKKNGNRGLPSLIQESIPSLQNIVIDGLQKAQNFTSSVEQLVENLDEKFDEATESGEENNWDDSKSTKVSHHLFRNAITNVKKFFALLGGITRILQG